MFCSQTEVWNTDLYSFIFHMKTHVYLQFIHKTFTHFFTHTATPCFLYLSGRLGTAIDHIIPEGDLNDKVSDQVSDSIPELNFLEVPIAVSGYWD